MSNELYARVSNLADRWLGFTIPISVVHEVEEKVRVDWGKQPPSDLALQEYLKESIRMRIMQTEAEI
jgi:hypothetical protein